MKKNADSLLFVVEGEKREKDLFRFISNAFFTRPVGIVPITVPAEMNIYMLYGILKADGFYTDIVEILREQVPGAEEKLQGYSRDDFSGVYLFFDFDEQANNIEKGTDEDYRNALLEMVDFFRDPTEEGKLYLSYPMIEAFRDFQSDSCVAANGRCYIMRDAFEDYKKLSSSSPFQQVKKYTFPIWKMMSVSYARRVCCLFHLTEINRESFLRIASQKAILEEQLRYLAKGRCVFVLSSLPAFLIDYSEKNYEALIGRMRRPNLVRNCQRKPPTKENEGTSEMNSKK